MDGKVNLVTQLRADSSCSDFRVDWRCARLGESSLHTEFAHICATSPDTPRFKQCMSVHRWTSNIVYPAENLGCFRDFCLNTYQGKSYRLRFTLTYCATVNLAANLIRERSVEMWPPTFSAYNSLTPRSVSRIPKSVNY